MGGIKTLCITNSQKKIDSLKHIRFLRKKKRDRETKEEKEIACERVDNNFLKDKKKNKINDKDISWHDNFIKEEYLNRHDNLL